MPFDGRTNQALSNRARLIAALRAPMPEGFTWDFTSIAHSEGCGTTGCALGLAFQLWPKFSAIYDRAGEEEEEVMKFFGITRDDVYNIFYGNYIYGRAHKDVTPEMVAEALERLG